MTNAKVLSLYVTMPDMMRSGHRMECDDFECDENGIVGSRDYGNEPQQPLLLVSQSSYDIIEAEDIILDKGILLENIYIDKDLYHLKKGSVIEIGEMLFEVNGTCEDYRYLYAFAPEVPDLIRGKRGLFVTPMEYGNIAVGNEVKIIQEA